MGHEFRRDYIFERSVKLNIDGDYHPMSEQAALDVPELTAEEREEFLRYRCVVHPVSGNVHDLYPWNWTMEVPRVADGGP